MDFCLFVFSVLYSQIVLVESLVLNFFSATTSTWTLMRLWKLLWESSVRWQVELPGFLSVGGAAERAWHCRMCRCVSCRLNSGGFGLTFFLVFQPNQQLCFSSECWLSCLVVFVNLRTRSFSVTGEIQLFALEANIESFISFLATGEA